MVEAVTEAKKESSEVLFDIPGGLDEVAGSAALVIAGGSAMKRGGLKLNSTELGVILGLLMRAREEAAAAAQASGGGAPMPDIKSLLSELKIDPKKAEKVGLEEKVLALKGLDKDALMMKIDEQLNIKDVGDLKIRMPVGKEYLEGKFALLDVKYNTEEAMKMLRFINDKIIPQAFAGEDYKSPKPVLLFKKTDGTLTGIRDDADLSKGLVVAVPEELMKNQKFTKLLTQRLEHMEMAMQPSEKSRIR